MNRAKKGKGPTFINAKTFRFKAHIGVGDDIGPGLRTKKELDKQKKKDPIELFKKKLIKLKIIDEQKEAQIINQINKKLESAVNHAKASPLGNIDDLIEDVYA
jgi:pyruvate dehydrogenase E1 component alpha subunit